MNLYLGTYYHNIVSGLLPFLMGRPLRIVSAFSSAQDGNRVWAKEPSQGFIKEPSMDAFPIQVWNVDQLHSLIDSEGVLEFHTRVYGFFEYSVRHVIYDLDPSPDSKLSETFLWVKGFANWLRSKTEVYSNVSVLYTGNRGFHVRACLLNRYDREAAYDYYESATMYRPAFNGKYDANVMTSRFHFIRCPYSWHTKGNRVSFFVDHLDYLDDALATRLSEEILIKCGGLR